MVGCILCSGDGIEFMKQYSILPECGRPCSELGELNVISNEEDGIDRPLETS